MRHLHGFMDRYGVAQTEHMLSLDKTNLSLVINESSSPAECGICVAAAATQVVRSVNFIPWGGLKSPFLDYFHV